MKIHSIQLISIQICSQLSERLEKQQAANRGELEKIRVSFPFAYARTYALERDFGEVYVPGIVPWGFPQPRGVSGAQRAELVQRIHCGWIE